MRGAAIILALAGLGSLPGCVGGCPAALLEGTLAERDGDLVVVHEDGFEYRVDWSRSGYDVRVEGQRLVVADWLGPKVGEGDFVSLGGGEQEPGRFRICGRFETEPIVPDGG